MIFSGNLEVDLLLALQQGATGEAGWGSFLGRLARITGADFAVMIARVPGRDRATFSIGAIPSGLPASLNESALNAIFSNRMREERIYSTAELTDLMDIGTSLSVDAALKILNATSTRAVQVIVPGTVSMIFAIFRTQEFGAADGAVLRRLFPYLRGAAHTAAMIWRERSRTTIATDLSRKTSLGWFLLDREGTIIESSIMAQDAPPGVRILPSPSGDRIAFTDRTAETKLQMILDGFAAHGGAPRRALRVSHDPPAHLFIAPLAHHDSLENRRPIAIATLHRECRFASDGGLLLVDLFGLLPSEARLASALARGDKLAHAAEKLGLTIETARYYSKKIFTKTGTHGQADLVRLVFANGLAELGNS